jgi:hypothetical protein
MRTITHKHTKMNACQDLWVPTCLTVNTLSPELNPICYLLALLAHDFLHVSRIRVKILKFMLFMVTVAHLVIQPILNVQRLAL